MKIYHLVVLITIVATSKNFSQNIQFDDNNNLIHQSKNLDYKATLKENIFNDLIFSDSNGNEVTFEKKYIMLKTDNILSNLDSKLNFFKNKIQEYRFDEQYIASYAVDIFDNLVFKSKNPNYKANLEKNIFDDLVFSDSNNNKITFKKKYIEQQAHELLSNTESKLDFFKSIIHEHNQDKAYEATFSIDIFDQIKIQDNSGYHLKEEKEPLNRNIINQKSDDNTSLIEKNNNGVYNYIANNERATLSIDITNHWSYDDSRGNKLIFGNKTWQGLKKRFQSEENILGYLINEFLHN